MESSDFTFHLFRKRQQEISTLSIFRYGNRWKNDGRSYKEN